jgi:DNA-binding winged helix-turn-helix (wHTH) protein
MGAVYRVADTVVGGAQNVLRRDGCEHHLRHKAFRTLLHLIEHADRVVTKEELFRDVWDSAAVTDGALVQCIREIRIALGDDPQHPQFVRTVAKVGYQFIGPVSRMGAAPDPGRGAPPSRRSRWPIVAAPVMALAMVALVLLARDWRGRAGHVDHRIDQVSRVVGVEPIAPPAAAAATGPCR